jgi:hypothetical protein
MNIEEAKESVGKMVMSKDTGHKLIPSGREHGPYKLLKVTKAGLVVLEGREEFRVPPSLIRLQESE